MKKNNTHEAAVPPGGDEVAPTGEGRAALPEPTAAIPAGVWGESLPELIPLDLDPAVEEEEPDWVVRRLLARGEVGVLSADTGAGKSIMVSALLVALVEEDAGSWLGFPVCRRPDSECQVVVVDEEQPSRVVRKRLRALGLDRGRHRVLYFNRSGLSLAAKTPSASALDAVLQEHRPAVVVIDTLMASSALEDVNSNDEAVGLMKYYRAMAEGHRVAVLLIAHHRKGTGGGGQAMMGARQWAGQADFHLSLSTPADVPQEEEVIDGVTYQRTYRELRVEKLRDGYPPAPLRVVIESASEDDALVTMEVRAEGEVSSDAVDLRASIVGALTAGPLPRGDLLESIGVTDGQAVKRAIDALKRSGQIAQDAPRKPYRLANPIANT